MILPHRGGSFQIGALAGQVQVARAVCWKTKKPSGRAFPHLPGIRAPDRMPGQPTFVTRPAPAPCCPGTPRTILISHSFYKVAAAKKR